MKYNKFVNEMVLMCSTIWLTKKVPAKWAHTKLVAIWKGTAKGKVEDPKAYRGIQIGSTFCKIMIVIILNRLKQWYENQISDQQQGFRTGRGTTDGIFILKRVQQIAHRTNQPIYALFIDLTAAFDHIDRKWLFQLIRQRVPPGANIQLFQLIESVYDYTTTALPEDNEEIFEIIMGVRQGGPESPVLFNLYIDYVMRIFLRRCGEKNIKFFKYGCYAIRSGASNTESIHLNLGVYGNAVIDWIGYADDLVLCFLDEECLADTINLLDSPFKRYRLALNIGKTMIFNHQKCNRSQLFR